MTSELATNKTVLLILLVVGFIILFPFISAMTKYAWDYTQGGVCQATAGLSSFKYEAACIDLAEIPITMTCPRRHVIIGNEESSVVEEGKEETLKVWYEGREVKEYSSLEPKMAESIIAEEMRSCWKKMGEGEAPILRQVVSRQLGDQAAAALVNTHACFICADITFENPVDIDLYRYLRTEQIPGKDFSYHTYFNQPDVLCEDDFLLAGQESDGRCYDAMEKYFSDRIEINDATYSDSVRFFSWEKFSEVFGGRLEPRAITHMQEMDTSKQQAVVFVRRNFPFCEADEGEDVGISNFVYVMPVDEVINVCHMVVT